MALAGQIIEQATLPAARLRSAVDSGEVTPKRAAEIAEAITSAYSGFLEDEPESTEADRPVAEQPDALPVAAEASTEPDPSPPYGGLD